MDDRDALGRIVREAWVEYCLETGDTKPSHIASWDELSEWDREADRRIGAAIAQHVERPVGTHVVCPAGCSDGSVPSVWSQDRTTWLPCRICDGMGYVPVTAAREDDDAH